MAYLFKQQFKISDLAPTSKELSVVIMEPDFYLAQLSARYLRESGFAAHHCFYVDMLPELLRHVRAVALLLNPESYEHLKHATSALSGISKDFPRLVTVTISHNMEAESLRELMSAGISGHINRSLSRPQDVAEIIKTLIN